ncbi:CDP-glycerol glycerophosphotransferase family protein [Heyndrickxia ginsengihumi]|uniref:CDP-glycerol glycerophosphotransferase family protein n=1 Tax=Heyndrickxia ginsengihumi TaxID=363870 RepID=UPI00278C77EB|nr:CDP-glycerol glycerophosphotransferase family protein [Heyndrickxia ginsengihumi]
MQKKIAFVVSFKQNNLYVYKEIKKQQIPVKIAFMCTSSCYDNVRKELPTEEVRMFGINRPFDFLKSIYHLATSEYVVVDNYYGFLAAVQFKDGVECIQLWHAAGAIKTFGLKDRNIHHRSNRALKRFKKVYSQFHKVVVGSDTMKHIFMEAFGLPYENFLCTGVPRTDFFYDEKLKSTIIKKLYDANPELRNKKIILYAPTFRDDELDHFQLMLDVEKMFNELHQDHVLLIKLHPAIRHHLELEDYNGFVFDYSYYKDVNELLLITDILITDYSSIPYEFSILQRPMIFYPYDLQKYEEKRGFWETYDKMVPGPVAFDTNRVIQLIKHKQFDIHLIADFSKSWNTYSTGKSSEKLVKYLYQHEGDTIVERS